MQSVDAAFNGRSIWKPIPEMSVITNDESKPIDQGGFPKLDMFQPKKGSIH